MKYRVFIYCHDCYNEDFAGCFDGGREEVFAIEVDRAAYDYNDHNVPITTKEWAELIGWEASTNRCAIWDYDVEEIKE